MYAAVSKGSLSFRAIILALVVGAWPCSGQVLMIGNSYTAGTRPYLEGFFNSAPEDCRLSVTAITPGGQTLYGHYGTASTLSTINTGGPWEHITLQEQSVHHSWARTALESWQGLAENANYFSEYQAAYVPPETANGANPAAAVYWGSSNILSYISASGASGAQVHIFQSWARRADVVSSHLSWIDTGNNAQNNDEHLKDNVLMARDVASLSPLATVSRIGEAWEAAQNADPSLNLYSGDGSHGNANGYFLAAAVLFQQITGIPATHSSYNGALNATVAANLKEVAEEFFDGKPFVISDFQRLQGGDLTLEWVCVPCAEYYVQSSPDLVTWTEIDGTRTSSAKGQVELAAQLSGDAATRKFFRVARQ